MFHKLKKKRVYLSIISFFLIIFSGLTMASEINATSADGLLVYVPTTPGTTIDYRTWNITEINFSAATTDTQSFSNNIEWAVLKANHERDEFILATLTSTTINCATYIYNGTGWGNYNLITSACGDNAARRPLTVAYEQISGDALILYENSSTADQTLSYQIWNGTGYNTASTFNHGLPSNILTNIHAVPKSNSDQIMVLGLTQGNDIFAVLWNGTGFEERHNVTLTASRSTSFRPFDFKWETQSGWGLVAYGVNNDNADLQTYDPINKVWSGAITDAIDVGNQEPTKIRMCNDPNSNDIGIIIFDSGNDVSVEIWDGSSIESSPTAPSDDTSTESSAISAINIDCAWNSTNGAIFIFVDRGNTADEEISYVTYNQNGWSSATLEGAALSPQVDLTTGSLENLRIDKNPVTDELIVTVIDNGADLNVIRYNESWHTLDPRELDASLECLDDTDCTSFAWSQYDTVPKIHNITPEGQNYNADAVINITANVTDNINVSAVLANVTLPNGTINQVTLIDSNADDVYNSTFSTTSASGTYTIRIQANDTSKHKNINSSETSTFSIGDVIAPNISAFRTPTSDESFSQNVNVSIEINVTDNINVSAVLANVTLPNTTVNQITLVNQSNNVTWLENFTATDTVGKYQILIIANDTTNNINTSQRNFTIGDTTPPDVLNVLPTAGSSFTSAGSIVNISANVTDSSSDISAVIANVTLPDGTISQITLQNLTYLDLYNFSFLNTGQNGTYNVTIIANDTENNINSSETTNFNVGDIVFPTITLDKLTDEFNTTDTTLTFNFTAIDNTNTFSCSLIVDSTTEKTNSSVSNDTTTNFILSSITEGSHQWNISCTDGASNANTSDTRTFRIDNTVPTFVSLTTSPSDEASLDPGTNVTAIANVTDNITYISNVILQYKLSNNSDYTNLTMVFDSDNLYNISFNASDAGTYNLRVFANDSLNNAATSNLVNISVQLDKTWTRTPVTFTPISTSLNANVTLGNLTVNNTGDYQLNFSINSTSATTIFNDTLSSTTNFTLNAGENYTISVNDSTSTSGVKSVILSINTTETDSDPVALLTTGTVIAAAGQPALVATITTIPSSVTQSDTGVEIIAQLDNIGEGNASNVSFYFTLPDDWTISSGDINITFEDFLDSDLEENTIQVDIASDAVTGDQIVIINATGVNASGSNLLDDSLIFGEQKTVTVNAKSSNLGASTGGSGPSGTSGAGGATGGSSGGSVIRLAGKETIETVEEFRILRGTSQTVSVVITNPFTNSRLTDVTLELQGFLSQYIKVNPPFLRSIGANKSKEFKLTIEVPAYLNQSEYNLTAIIKGSLHAINPTLAGFSRKAFEETRSILLFVHAVAGSEANNTLMLADQAIKDMAKAGFPTERVIKMFQTALEQLELNNFETAFGLANQILKIKEEAFEVDALIKEIQANIEKANSKWLDTPETKKALTLALKAFEREDFATALQRAKDTQLTYILETKGRINILWFLKTYWWAIILGMLILSISSFLIYRRFIITIIAQRLKNLAKEETSLESLMKDAQFKYIKENSISGEEYHKLIAQYESRLNKIQQIKTKLRNKRVGIVKTEQELDNLQREEKEVIGLLKKEQKDYLQLGKLTRKQFLGKYESDKRRLVEVQEEKELAREKLGRDKISKKYKVLSFVNNTYLKVRSLFKKKPDLVSKKEIERVIRKPSKIRSSEEQPKKEPKKKTLQEQRKESNNKAKRMSKEELEKRFPGAFK